MLHLLGAIVLLEDRRRRALALSARGYSLNEVGRRIGCAGVSVMRWRDARRRGGAPALQVRFSPGRPWKLGEGERKRLVGVDESVTRTCKGCKKLSHGNHLGAA